MGWLRTIFLGDIGNRLDIGDVENDLARTRRQLRSRDREVQKRIDELEKENDELKLCLAGLVRLLIQRGAFSREDLVALIEEIDREDGVADRKTEGPVV